ncbi:unnamed protein product [Linum trigynum]|uniref:Uncharacterized protein n=1 Tax=Linum trigynum TaxID=586398 RepID=A0AAV2FVD8_9ROSI
MMVLIHQPSLFMAVVAILWRIWRFQNWVIFEGKQLGIPALMHQFHQRYDEWVSLPVDRLPQPSIPLINHFAPEEANMLVCMWDGATRSGSHSAGGMVIMSPARNVLMASGIQISLIDDPMVVELLVLRVAIV